MSLLRLPLVLLAFFAGEFFICYHVHADAAATASEEPHLSLMARLGRQIFYDAKLSGSGTQSCASCHSPERAYGPPNDLSVQMGGPHGDAPGLRAVPSLKYLAGSPGFSIGPEDETAEHVNISALASDAQKLQRADKVAGVAAAVQMVPQGGLFWDGRANTFEDQANGPMFSPFEMAAGDVPTLAKKLRNAAYVHDFVALFGAHILGDDQALVAKALFAVGRYQYEDSSFHPYNSKYDYYLAGKVKLSDVELRGLKVFEDKDKGNCAACHLDKLSPSGQPPLFTDHEFEALGVPRNHSIAANADPEYYDLGLCGPLRTDLKKQPQYCGMFITPTLRNVATRKVFFHNGFYHDLRKVLRFYARRETNPEQIYPPDRDGRVLKYDDLPARYQANIDTQDAPFTRKAGDKPALSDRDIEDLVAFLRTLTDGFRPGNPYKGGMPR